MYKGVFQRNAKIAMHCINGKLASGHAKPHIKSDSPVWETLKKCQKLMKVFDGLNPKVKSCQFVQVL